MYYKLGLSANSGPLSWSEKLVREVCLRLARVLDDVQQFSQMNKELSVAYSAKDDEVLELTRRLEDSERQVGVLQSHLVSKDTEIQDCRRACRECEDKLTSRSRALFLALYF